MENINLNIENTKNQIEEILNNSNLPIGVIYYLFKDLCINIEHQYYANLNSLILKLLQLKEEKSSILKD